MRTIHLKYSFLKMFVRGEAGAVGEISKGQIEDGVFGAIAGLIALAAAMGIGRFAFTPVLPMMQADAGITIAAGAWLASANYIGYFIGSLSALVLRVRPATAIRAGLVVISVSTLGMGFERDVAVWALLRFVAGIGSALVLIFVFAWSADQFSYHRRHWFSGIVFAGTGVGVAISGALCLALAQVKATSTFAWILLGLLSSAFTVIVWFAFATNSSVKMTRTMQESGKTLWSGESLRLVGCYGLFGYGYIIPATFLPVMARAIIPDPSLFGWAWPIFGSAAVVSTLVTAPLAQRFNHRTIWIGAHFIMAMGILLPALFPSLLAILIAALPCRGYVHGCSNGGNARSALDLGPKQFGGFNRCHDFRICSGTNHWPNHRRLVGWSPQYKPVPLSLSSWCTPRSIRLRSNQATPPARLCSQGPRTLTLL
jgi:MFS family permease